MHICRHSCISCTVMCISFIVMIFITAYLILIYMICIQYVCMYVLCTEMYIQRRCKFLFRKILGCDISRYQFYECHKIRASDIRNMKTPALHGHRNSGWGYRSQGHPRQCQIDCFVYNKPVSQVQI